MIQIIDDGRGLNKEKIIAKAIKQNLVKEDDTLSDQDIFNFIFHPGFSTAEKVSDISGRGIGMDVVKKNIERLRGKVEIESETGKDFTLTIRLPLTLAIIDGMVVMIGKQRYIIPLVSIEESFRPAEKDILTVINRGEMIMMREQLLPLVRLYETLNITPRNMNPWESMIVVVESGETRCCFMVDELIGQQQVVIKTLGDSFENIKAISGGAIMGDGRVGLILDVDGIMQHLGIKKQ